MPNVDLLRMTISELAPKIESKEVSPVELTEAALAEADRLQPTLNSFITILHDRAMDQAREAASAISRGVSLGPLHGIPYGVKDIFDVAGLPTTAGSRTLGENIASADSTATRRLSEAGMIVLGKTVTVEFARGIVGINHIPGTPQTPWHAAHPLPGGGRRWFFAADGPVGRSSPGHRCRPGYRNLATYRGNTGRNPHPGGQR